MVLNDGLSSVTAFVLLQPDTGNIGTDTKEGALYSYFTPAGILVAFCVGSLATVRTDPARPVRVGKQQQFV